MLKPQDVLVLLKLAMIPGQTWTYASLSESVGMSASETHAAVDRAISAGLYSALSGGPIRAALIDFIVHGVPYVYHVNRGVPTSRGMQTGFAARPLDGPDGYAYEARYVWPTPDGTDSGWTLAPLYKSAPYAARQDGALYAVLALVDELRIGRARERARAANLLAERLR